MSDGGGGAAFGFMFFIVLPLLCYMPIGIFEGVKAEYESNHCHKDETAVYDRDEIGFHYCVSNLDLVEPKIKPKRLTPAHS